MHDDQADPSKATDNMNKLVDRDSRRGGQHRAPGADGDGHQDQRAIGMPMIIPNGALMR